MGKIIDGDELIELLLSTAITDKQRKYSECVQYAVQKMPTVDAVPVRHGQWIERGYMGNDNWDYMCSVCGAGEVHTKRVEVRYCWNCGARMDGKGNCNATD